jgi:hypothetical protein
VCFPYCRGAYVLGERRTLGLKLSDQKEKRLRSSKHTCVADKFDRHLQHRPREESYPDLQPPLLHTRTTAERFPHISQPNFQFKFPAKPSHNSEDMASSKPNSITTCYDGRMGEREFVFACRGRPFTVLTAPQFPTPAFTMIDHNLVRELRLTNHD